MAQPSISPITAPLPSAPPLQDLRFGDAFRELLIAGGFQIVEVDCGWLPSFNDTRWVPGSFLAKRGHGVYGAFVAAQDGSRNNLRDLIREVEERGYEAISMYPSPRIEAVLLRRGWHVGFMEVAGVSVKILRRTAAK